MYSDKWGKICKPWIQENMLDLRQGAETHQVAILDSCINLSFYGLYLI